MKITGLITEYNPFHNGHKYHIEQARELTGADAIIVVMSGNFVQRGTPAILPKHMRAKAALQAGASLVLELPVCYATGSAEYFAHGAVSLLDQLGCVDSICFGSECGDITLLQEVSRVICNEPPTYQESLQAYLKSGDSFPLARQKALKTYFSSEMYDSILSEPNNILGLEYLKALQRIGSPMKPYTIPRISSGYHDTCLQDQFSSATAIRNQIASGDLSVLRNQIPDEFLEDLMYAYETRFPVFPNDFSLLLKYRLLSETKDSLLQYADVSEELANRILNRRNQFMNFEQFSTLLKTKEMTHTRINRALIHILLNIKKLDYTGIHYARVLGFHMEHLALLTMLKKHTRIPIISKLAADIELDDLGRRMLDSDIYASDLYESIITDKFHTKFINEYEQQIVRII